MIPQSTAFLLMVNALTASHSRAVSGIQSKAEIIIVRIMTTLKQILDSEKSRQSEGHTVGQTL